MNGFSIEQWKKKFGEIKSHDQSREETKELAAEGERLMNRIEINLTMVDATISFDPPEPVVYTMK